MQRPEATNRQPVPGVPEASESPRVQEMRVSGNQPRTRSEVLEMARHVLAQRGVSGHVGGDRAEDSEVWRAYYGA